MAQWKFRFDKSYLDPSSNPSGCAATAGLVPSFSRSESTVDPEGNSVSSGVARFDRSAIVAPVLTDTGLTIGGQGAAPASRVFASGVGADGSTPVTVFKDDDHAQLYVNTGTNNSAVGTALVETLLDGATVGYPVSTVYAIPVSGESNAPRIVPQSAIVAHGLIVLGGVYLERLSTEAPNYRVRGWGFLVSTNGGASWTQLWNDSAQSNPQFNHWRGREWCLHVSFALNMVARPLECWVASTDYRVQIDSSNRPLGGRVTLIRFTRPDESSSNWSWIPGSSGNPFTYFIDPGFDTSATGCHLHSAHVADYGATGLQLVVAVGDSQPHSRFVRFTIDDVTQSGQEAAYADPANWTVDQGGYHGYYQTSSVLGSRSQQPVGVAMGPRSSTSKPFVTTTATRSTVIWSGDEQAEVLTRMVLPEPSESPNQLWVEHLYGYCTGFGSDYGGSFSRLRGIVFSLTQARPEKANTAAAAPMVAVLSNAEDARSMTRLLYCPDPVDKPTLWMQLANRWSGSSGTAVLHGSKVYFSAYGDSNPQTYGLRSLDVSGLDTTIFKPIIVAPGGKNLLIETCFVDAGDQAQPFNGNPGVHLLTKGGGGVWIDTLPGFVIRKLPHPPSLSSRVFRVHTRRTVTGGSKKFICRIHLSGALADQWNQLASGQGWVTGSQVRRVRCWVLDGSFGVLTGASGSSSPNKTAQMSMRTRTGFDTGENPPIPQGAPLL